MNRVIYLGCIFFLYACGDKVHEKKMFEKISVEHSNLNFTNTITENDVLNILDYEYLYNGGGVGVGDFNSDGLLDIFFSGNMVTSRLYINQGNLKFKDVTEEAGVSTNSWCTGVSVIDINNDGKLDIHVATAHDRNLNKSKNYFFINTSDASGNTKFENRAEQMHLDDESYSIQAAWLDYDNDSDLDLFLINNSKEQYPKNNPFGQRKDGSGRSTDKLFRNEGIQKNGLPLFSDVSKEAGIQIEGWSLGVMVLDINNDLHPDIYVANDFISNDLLYVNNGDGTFSNKIADYFKHQSHNSMGVDAADINNDGGLDLLVLDMLPEDNLRHKTMFGSIPFERFRTSLERGYQPQYVRNVLQVNNGEGFFSDLGYLSGLSATDWSWSPLLADFDNDGLRDAYITNGYKKDITDMDFIDYNNKTAGFGSIEKRKAVLAEQLSKMEGVKKSNFFFKNIDGTKFHESTEESGLKYPSFSNGATYADLDNDGDLDLVMNNIDDPAFLFENKTNTSEEKSANYFRIMLPADVQGIGAEVSLFIGDDIKYAEFYPQRGYLSSSEPFLHFGLGERTNVDSLKITWPNKNLQIIKNIRANQVLTLSPKDGKTETKPEISENFHSPTKYFEQMASANFIPYVHKESAFDDFKKWPLHFRSYSKNGPVIEVGDIDADGNDDIFIGGTANKNGRFFVQQNNGGFNELIVQDSVGRLAEDTAALFFDSDNDGDLDLYCASGSSENYSQKERYQDRLYRNDGSGNFSPHENGLPKIETDTHTVVPIDFDKDGDLDLFVGGRILPERYPFAPRSYLLRNDKGRFTDVTSEKGKDLLQPGMVTDAYVTDLNGDGWQDLVLVGEWMRIQIYYNNEGVLNLDSKTNGLEKTNGWWNCLDAADFDNDGDIDFIAGNWGLNNPFTASEDFPISIYAEDYDQNGSIEPIMTYINQGSEYIFHPRRTLAGQLPMLNSSITDYRTYGSLKFSEIFSTDSYKNLQVFNTFLLASSYIENLGKGKFRVKALPDITQRSPVFDFHISDINKDGNFDILSVGNFEAVEVLSGSYDSGNGAFLQGDGKGNFQAILKSGFYVSQEARTIKNVSNTLNQDLMVIGLQKDSIRILKKMNSNTHKSPL